MYVKKNEEKATKQTSGLSEYKEMVRIGFSDKNEFESVYNIFEVFARMATVNGSQNRNIKAVMNLLKERYCESKSEECYAYFFSSEIAYLFNASMEIMAVSAKVLGAKEGKKSKERKAEWPPEYYLFRPK